MEKGKPTPAPLKPFAALQEKPADTPAPLKPFAALQVSPPKPLPPPPPSPPKPPAAEIGRLIAEVGQVIMPWHDKPSDAEIYPGVVLKLAEWRELLAWLNALKGA